MPVVKVLLNSIKYIIDSGMILKWSKMFSFQEEIPYKNTRSYRGLKLDQYWYILDIWYTTRTHLKIHYITSEKFLWSSSIEYSSTKRKIEWPNIRKGPPQISGAIPHISGIKPHNSVKIYQY